MQVLERPVSEKLFRRLMRALCTQLRGNRGVLDPMRQMRLPGGIRERTEARAALVLAGERYYRARQVAHAIRVSADDIERYFDGPHRKAAD